jgi:mRNA interferase RelE/StbE
LGKQIKIVFTRNFSKSIKKLKANQKADLDTAIHGIIADPLIGEQKKGDLAYLRVYKFTMVNQLTLLGYHFDEGEIVLQLITFGSHENFYRDLKR